MNQTPERYEDEIDLLELFRKLWAGRLVVVLAVLVGGIVGAGVFLAAWLKQPQVTIMSLEVRFNFPGIQNSAYPNGQSFSINDLVAPAILNPVYDQYQLTEYGLSRSEFIKSVQIAPFATNRDFIEARFKNALSQKGLSSAEIDELNANYAQALAAASRRFARLTLTLEERLALPRDLMMQILAAIPTTWSRESIENYGVLDIAAATSGELNKDLVNNYEYLVSSQYLKEYLDYVTRSVEALKNDEVGRLLVDTESGMSVDTVVESLSNLEEFHVNVLQRSFAVAPVVRDPDEALFYLNNQIIRLQEQLDQLQRQASVIDQAYEQLLTTGRRPLVAAGQEGQVGGYTAQYGDEFLTRLMAIGDELSESKFKQSLLNQSVVLKMEAEEVITRINSLQKNLQALRADNTESEVVKNRVDTEIQYITTRLETLAATVNRLAVLRNQRVLGQTGALYNLNGEATVITNFRSQLKTLIKFSVFGVVAGLFIGLLLALGLAVVRSGREQKENLVMATPVTS